MRAKSCSRECIPPQPGSPLGIRTLKGDSERPTNLCFGGALREASHGRHRHDIVHQWQHDVVAAVIPSLLCSISHPPQPKTPSPLPPSSPAPLGLPHDTVSLPAGKCCRCARRGAVAASSSKQASAEQASVGGRCGRTRQTEPAHVHCVRSGASPLNSVISTRAPRGSFPRAVLLHETAAAAAPVTMARNS